MRALVFVLKVVGSLLLGLVLVLVLAAAGLWWWAGTPSSLDFALRQLAKYQPIEAQGVTGTLRTGLQARHLQWELAGLKVEAFDLQLAWQPLALARAALQLDQFRAARLRIEDRRPPRPGAAPTSIVLPLRVEIDELRVGQLQWITPERTVEAGDIAASYDFDLARHQLQIGNLQWDGGNYSGQASLGAQAPMPLQAQLQGRLVARVPGGVGELPLTFGASIDGPLADMQARAELRVFDASAVASARLTPWAAQVLPQVQAEFRQLDARTLWPQAPRTDLSGRTRVQPAGTATWSISVEATNAIAGPWDEHQLPVSQLNAALEWRTDGSGLLVRTLQARIGDGQLSASGELQPDGSWTVDARVQEVNPAVLYSGLAPLPLSGTAQVTGDARGVDFDAALTAIGAAPPSQANRGLAALELRSASARGRWSDDTLSLAALDVRMADASLSGKLELRPQARAGSGSLTLDAPGLALKADGRISETAGDGQAQLTSTNLPQALAWLARFPDVPDALGTAIADGRGEAQLAWQGGWRNPAIQAKLAAPVIVPAGEMPWAVRDLSASLDGRLSDAQLRVRARAEQGQRRASIDLAGHGGRRGGAQASAPWLGQLNALDAAISDPAVGKGPWTLKLQSPLDWRWGSGRFDAGAGRALIAAPRAGAPAQLSWDAVRWSGGELHTAGRLQGLPLAWLELARRAQSTDSFVMGDLVFDAQWDATLGATPRIRASLVRSRGDLAVLAETAQGQSARVAAGVREARLSLQADGDTWAATLLWNTERGGTAEGRVTTKLVHGSEGWQWPQDAPLTGSLQARLPRIGVWSVLAPPGWRLRGSLAADLAIGGTRAAPQLSGNLAADDLALRSVVDGFEMQGGRLRASIGGQRLLIEEFSLHGPGADGGTLMATGEATWSPSGPQVHMSAQAQRLRASTRSDRQITVSGTLTGRRDATGTVIDGKLRVDQALIVLPEEGTPRLGDDVVVRGAAAKPASVPAAEEAARQAEGKLQVGVDMDLGDDFRVRGMGIDTRLQGTVTVSGESLAAPRLAGTIRTSGGQYRAYGQRLDLERGLIRFTGPVDNPSLDILAIRPNLPQQRVGVQIGGTALSPRIQLYSDPDLPDAEKLSWLVTGRAAPEGGAESAVLEQAALALLSKRAGVSQGGIASTFGLDELSVRRDSTEGAAVTLGRRFGSKLYAAYERSLSGAVGTLSLFYDVSRRLTVRAQTGDRTALDLIYTFTFN